MTMIRPDIAVLARIRTSKGSLGPSEAKVASVILADAEEVVDWSTAELASRAGTSTATVIRACQSLGFRGFQHLRLELARSVPLLPREQDDIVGGTFNDALVTLRLAQESIDPARIETIAEEIRAAARVVLVGNGFSGPPLQDFAMRLSTLGRWVEAPVDPLAQQFAVHSLKPGEICFALSYSGANVQTLQACAAAAERNARVLVVTSYAQSPLGRLADLVVSTGPVAGSHDVDPYLARLGHTVALHAIHAAIGRHVRPAEMSDMRHVVVDALAEG
ncbi:SIS domain-containing protein [Vibrio cholerae]|nr:SIS domain-containing protein [Vibrio cholerae]